MGKKVFYGVRGALEKLTPDQKASVYYYNHTVSRYASESENSRCAMEWLALTKSEATGYLKGLKAAGIISETDFRCLNAYIN